MERPTYGMPVRIPAADPEGNDPSGRQVQPNAVESGTRLADRYRLEERIEAEDGFATWHAIDEKLSRPVGVHIMPRDHPRAGAVVAAARAAAMIGDTRFLQVLDAAEENGFIYIVKEWLPTAASLARLLDDGPLAPAEAAHLVREVAEALGTAHDAGLSHLCIGPGDVLRTDTGQVKVIGLRIAAALHGLESDDPVTVDTRALGALLYAALTARWPYGAAAGLPGAPYQDSGVCSPRQVRAGVPAVLDDITMLSLGVSTEAGERPFSSPAEVVSALDTIPRRPRPEMPDHSTVAPSAPLIIDEPPSPWPSRAARGAFVGVGALILGGLALLGWQMGMTLFDGSEGRSPAAAGAHGRGAQTQDKPFTLASAQDFDPYASPASEHPEDAPLAVDGDPGTAWETMTYYSPALGGLKPGVGLVVDLGQARKVGEAQLQFTGPGTDFQLRAAGPGVSSMPGSPDEYRLVREVSGAGQQVSMRFGDPVQTRYLLVWLTELPSAGDGYRIGISEVSASS
ncbi:MAG: serine/threonine protein kinase [Carbonactinosporaceae bacterium]